MKRIHKLIIALLFIVASLILSGCSEHQDSNSYNPNQLHLDRSYELVAANVESHTQVSGDISGKYLMCFGSMSGNIETTTTKVYNYWYKRSDGGIISKAIDMSSYNYPENVTVVIYEDDSTTPKVEIWRNLRAQNYGDGEYYLGKTEFRFTIPSGSFVNTYDLQGLTGSSQ